MSQNPYRDLPSISKLLALPAIIEARTRHPHEAITAAARAELDTLRSHLAAGDSADGFADLDSIGARVLERLETESAPRIRPVINATGVVLHTNLGRSPL